MNFSSESTDTKPIFGSTDRSSIRNVGQVIDPETGAIVQKGYRQLMLDPSIRAGEESALGGIGKAAGQYGGQISQLRQSAIGNLPDYINSLLNPMRQSFAQQQGQLQQNLGQRGLGGSSFYGQALSGMGADQQRALTDAAAQARMGGIQGISGLLGQEFGAAQITPQMEYQLAQDRAKRELGILGLTGAESRGSKFGILS